MKRGCLVVGLGLLLAAPASASNPPAAPALDGVSIHFDDAAWMKKGPKLKVKAVKVKAPKFTKVKRPKYGKTLKRRGPPAHAMAWGYRYRTPARVVRWR